MFGIVFSVAATNLFYGIMLLFVFALGHCFLIVLWPAMQCANALLGTLRSNAAFADQLYRTIVRYNALMRCSARSSSIV